MAARNRYGKGKAYYMGSLLDPKAMKAFVAMALKDAGVVPLLDLPHGVQVVRRGRVWFLTNHTAKPVSIKIPGNMKALLGGSCKKGKVMLAGWGFAVVKE